ncbi:glutamine synthetase family protein [Ravibacter arvi]|uniref:Glutamine synthetase family protein n=1 Tax=Ravibacter arvi TaxID=2051041 RepID=A0ABP8LZ42_9BACT
MKHSGLIEPAAIQQLIHDGEIETVILAFTDHYGRFLGKRLDADYFADEALLNGSHGCDYLLTTDMAMEPVAGYEFASWELGYGDFHLVPDLTTIRKADWLDKTAIVLCDLFDDKAHAPVAVAPRNLLKRQLENAEKEGWAACAATELEYYLFENSYRAAFEQHYQDLRPAGYYLEDYHLLQGTRNEGFTGKVRRHLKNSGIQVENSKGEWGLGQHEINIKYADLLKAADNHVLFKQCLKEVADSQGLSLTFMAKFATDQAGSSSHIHLSLWKNGKNAFTGDHQLGPVKGTSDYFRWFLGGWLAHVPDVMPFYAPTVNSYKRFVDGSWAPTRLAWSFDNRTAGFRVVGSGSSLRIECRIPGADCNPYLALAASIASGLDGIKHRIEPPECFIGDIYAAAGLPRVPYTLSEAIAGFEKSSFAREAFGEKAFNHYLHFFKAEQKAYDIAVNDWELKRYFEQI